MALNAYMRLTGDTQGDILGSVTQAGREDSIMVIAFDHLVHQTTDNTGAPTGGREHRPLVITKEVDKSSPLLANALVNAENLSTVEIQFWEPSATGAEVQYYTIRLQNAHIAGIKTEMLNNKYPENMQHKTREKVSFYYQRIEWEWVDGGVSATDTV